MTGLAKFARFTTILLLAAGASKRMKGVDKLLEPIDGIPLLRRSASACLGSAAAHVAVVLPTNTSTNRARLTALDGLSLRRIQTPDWAEGMGGSLRAGIRCLAPGSTAVIIALADMPEIRAEDYDRLIAAAARTRGKTIFQASTQAGTPGLPVLFRDVHFPALGNLTGDRGGRDIIRAHAKAKILVPLPGDRALCDLDTAEDWRRYRAR